MKKEDISEALNEVDSAMVENAYKKKQNPAWRKWLALAACLVFALIVAFPGLKLHVPVWDADQIPVGYLVGSFTMGGNGATSYTEVYASDANPLDLHHIPLNCYLNVYEATDAETELNEAQFEKQATSFLSKLSKSLGIEEPAHTTKTSFDDIWLQVDSSLYFIDGFQTGSVTSLSFDNLFNDTSSVVLDGNPVQIDHEFTDEEILRTLQPIKRSLFQIFGRSFSDAKIRESTGITVYFYNERDHYLNKYLDMPVSDYISIHFDIVGDGSGVLNKVKISYRQLRVDANDRYALLGKSKKLSLNKAEEYLEKGYVFDGVCCLCATSPEEVVFGSYDFVSLEYRNILFEEDRTLKIPVYAFYKELRTLDNGTVCYAKTYVPAIEVDGYEEYFIERHKKHEERAK